MRNLAIAGVAETSSISLLKLLGIILAFGFMIRVAFLFLTPTFYAPDEESHYKYIKYLAENKTLPIQTKSTGSETNDWEYYQPPLYYVALAPFYAVSKTFIADDYAIVRVLRFFSILLWLVTVFFAFKIIKVLQISDVYIATFAVSMVSLLPTYTSLSSVINNDNLVIAFGGAILYFALKPPSLGAALMNGILIGLAMLTKLSAVIYAVFIVSLAAIELSHGRFDRKKMGYFFLTAAVAFMLWAPWCWRNWLVYGSITAEGVANVPMKWKSASYAVSVTANYIQYSFWAVSGIYNNISSFFPRVGRLLMYVSMFGLAAVMFFQSLIHRKRLIWSEKNSLFFTAAAITIVVNIALTFRFGVLYGQGQGRFLFPMIIPIALFLAMGIRAFKVSDSKNASAVCAVFFVVYALSFMLFSVVQFAKV